MKYKIQNHFVHNGVQVWLNKSAFPYFVLQVKQEKTTQWKKKTTPHTSQIYNLPRNIHLKHQVNCSGWLKYVVLKTYVGCRQETDFNVCIFFSCLVFSSLCMLSSACTSILCMYKHAKWLRTSQTHSKRAR